MIHISGEVCDGLGRETKARDYIIQSLSNRFAINLCAIVVSFAMSQPVFSTTTKGNTLGIFDGYNYRVDRQSKSRIFLRCVTSSCRGRASCDTISQCVKVTKDHGCTQDATAEIVIPFKRLVKKRVREEGTAVPRIVEQEHLNVLKAFGTDAGRVVPDYNEFGRGLHYARVKAFRIDNLPTTQSDLVIAKRWKTTHDGDPFLLLDKLVNGGRMLVFGSLCHRHSFHPGLGWRQRIILPDRE